MSKHYPPFTAESARRMIAFLLAFEHGDFRGANDHYLASGRDLRSVDDLSSEVYESGFVLPFDWTGWDCEGALATIDTADLLTLRKLMTAFVGGDRFCGGAMSGLCADGSVERVLRRLKEITASSSTAPPPPPVNRPAPP